MSHKTAKTVSYIFYVIALALILYTNEDGTRLPLWVWAIPAVIGVAVWMRFGKCPYCGAQLSISLASRKCPSCGRNPDGGDNGNDSGDNSGENENGGG